jgi:predicted nucleic acid-binding protein
VKKYGVSFYDASYHALAIIEKGVFVTADARYLRKVGSGQAIRHVSEWIKR